MGSCESYTAEEVINEGVAPGGTAEAIIGRLWAGRERVSSEEAGKIDAYIRGIRPQIEGVLTQDLGAGIGGQFNGAVTMGTSSLYVHTSIEDAIASAAETREHEDYHEAGDHLAGLTIVDDTRASFIAVIGGHRFADERAVIEGITVTRTGDEHVSEEYKRLALDFRSAIAAAGISLTEAEEAINEKHDMRYLDDRTRAAFVR